MLTVAEMRDAAIRYLLYEQTRRVVKQEPTLPSFTDDQLGQLVCDLVTARNIESKD
jgi:hypothetical protein